MADNDWKEKAKGCPLRRDPYPGRRAPWCKIGGELCLEENCGLRYWNPGPAPYQVTPAVCAICRQGATI